MSWLGRARDLHAELASIADVDPTWWLLAGAAAAIEALPARTDYVVSDAGPATDTFIGHRAADPPDVIADAIAAAHAARTAIRELDGQLPDQPLAVTIARGPDGARKQPTDLDVAAFAIGDVVLHAHLAERIEDEVTLSMRLGDAIRDERVRQQTALRHSASSTRANVSTARTETATEAEAETETATHPARTSATREATKPHPRRSGVAVGPRSTQETSTSAPFVCISLGEDRITVARHGHRRAWQDGIGPWLGLGRVGGLVTTSTCHLVVDGYGHAWLAARIGELRAVLRKRAPGAGDVQLDLPHLSLVPDAIPLGVAWRELPQPAPRSLPLAYGLGCVLHRLQANPKATFSPTFQLPVALGERDDPARLRRRVVATTLSVRFANGIPEPFEVFAARVKERIAREAAGDGLITRLLAAARAVPLPLAFKRRSITGARSAWFERFAQVIGGRAYLSKITLTVPSPYACAVSSPSRMATTRDPMGACVITIIDDGERAAITACGSGLAGEADDAADLIDALLRELAAERNAS